jgi:hypothetical protein
MMSDGYSCVAMFTCTQRQIWVPAAPTPCNRSSPCGCSSWSMCFIALVWWPSALNQNVPLRVGHIKYLSVSQKGKIARGRPRRPFFASSVALSDAPCGKAVPALLYTLLASPQRRDVQAHSFQLGGEMFQHSNISLQSGLQVRAPHPAINLRRRRTCRGLRRGTEFLG